MNNDLPGLVSRVADLNVLVIGDAMLDSYLTGSASRLCQEAPAPVVALTERTDAPGGAANTAANVAALGAAVTLLAVVGDDEAGQLVRRGLMGRGVCIDGVVVEPGRGTLTKQRIIADRQLIARLDSGDTGPLTDESARQLIDRLTALAPACDLVIVSDYGYGVLTPAVRAALATALAATPLLLVVDAKDLAAYRELRPAAVKPNYQQACGLLGERPVMGGRVRAQAVAASAARLLAATGAQVVAVTLDADGALLIERDAPPYRTYARPGPALQAAGAGDTFLAALGLALAAGATTPAAAEVAAAAADLVVARAGTVCCAAEALTEALRGEVKLFPSVEGLLLRLTRERAVQRRIVFTNGCFDLLHRGHVAYLNRAKALGDVLVVGLNSDDSVRRLKGPDRPLNPLDDRAQVLAALRCVDYIVPFSEDTPARLIEALRPDIYVKGGDYRLETLPERALVEALGGSVQILAYVEDRSTTGLIERLRGGAASRQPAALTEASVR